MNRVRRGPIFFLLVVTSSEHSNEVVGLADDLFTQIVARLVGEDLRKEATLGLFFQRTAEESPGLVRVVVEVLNQRFSEWTASSPAQIRLQVEDTADKLREEHDSRWRK